MIIAFCNCCNCCARHTHWRDPSVLDWFVGLSVVATMIFLNLWLWRDMRKVFKDDYKK